MWELADICGEKNGNAAQKKSGHPNFGSPQKYVLQLKAQTSKHTQL